MSFTCEGVMGGVWDLIAFFFGINNFFFLKKKGCFIVDHLGKGDY